MKEVSYEELGQFHNQSSLNFNTMKFRVTSKRSVCYSLLFISVVTFLIIFNLCRTNCVGNGAIRNDLPYEIVQVRHKPVIVTSTEGAIIMEVASPTPVQNEDNVSSELYSLNDTELIGPSIAMDDPKLVAKLRNEFLLPPPPANVSLNLTSSWLYDTSMGQSLMIRKILGNKRNGFFIECGALDGETRSNSLVFERLYNWTGLLIEADPLNYEEAVYKRRKAYLSQSCLSVKPYPIIVSFEQAHNMGKIAGAALGRDGDGRVDVRCFPLLTYMLALNRTVVDYLSLDVEGSELEVLETVPFDKIDIRTLSVEFIHGVRGKQAISDFMESKGYEVYGEVTHFNYLANDFIFVKKSILPSAPANRPTR